MPARARGAAAQPRRNAAPVGGGAARAGATAAGTGATRMSAMAPGARAALGSLLGPSDLKAAEATEAVGAAGQGQGQQGQGQGGGVAAGAPFAPGDHLERMARAAGVPAMDEGDALAFLARSWAAEMRQVTLTPTLSLTLILTLTLAFLARSWASEMRQVRGWVT